MKKFKLKILNPFSTQLIEVEHTNRNTVIEHVLKHKKDYKIVKPSKLFVDNVKFIGYSEVSNVPIFDDMDWTFGRNGFGCILKGEYLKKGPVLKEVNYD
jgi:hypothetical protein